MSAPTARSAADRHPLAAEALRTAVSGACVEAGAPPLCRSWSATDLVRPESMNAERSNHWREHRKATREARERWAWLWRQVRVPALDRVVILATPAFARNPQDTGNSYPSVKPAVDALVDLGVLPKDTGRHVLAVAMLAPVKAPDGLTVSVLEVPDA